MIELLAIALMSTQPSLAQTAIVNKPKIQSGQLAIFDGSKYLVTKPITLSGVITSANCKAKPSCAALQSLKAKPEFPSPAHASMQNPAASLCANLGGTNLIALNHTGAEENVCQFKDMSFVNSWDLFYKHFPKKTIK